MTCETCGGEGTVIEFRRFAGEYQAGEPVEVECEDCNGTGETDDYKSPPVSEEALAAYRKWCAEVDLQKQVARDLSFTIEQQRKVA